MHLLLMYIFTLNLKKVMYTFFEQFFEILENAEKLLERNVVGIYAFVMKC